MQAEGVHGKATGGVVDGCGPEPDADHSRRELARRLRALCSDLEDGVCSSAREHVVTLHDAAKAFNDLRSQSEAEDRERDADRLLVVEEMGRAAGLELRGWLRADLVTLATGQGPEDRLTTSVKNTWWRMLVAAARELRRLREVTGHAPEIQVGRATLAELAQGWRVDCGSAYLNPHSDFPAKAVRRALEPPSVDALAERIRGVIQARALRLLATAADPRDYTPAHVARIIAEELCR